MRILKRLLRITRIALLAILAVYAGAALVLVNPSGPQFKSGTGPTATAEMSEMLGQVCANLPDKLAMRDKAVMTKYSAGEVILVDGERHDGICYNGQAMAAAGNSLVKNGCAETNLGVR